MISHVAVSSNDDLENVEDARDEEKTINAWVESLCEGLICQAVNPRDMMPTQ